MIRKFINNFIEEAINFEEEFFVCIHIEKVGIEKVGADKQDEKKRIGIVIKVMDEDYDFIQYYVCWINPKFSSIVIEGEDRIIDTVRFSPEDLIEERIIYIIYLLLNDFFTKKYLG